jgi:hypothetical protein
MELDTLSDLIDGLSNEEKKRFDRFAEDVGRPLFRSLVKDGVIDIERTSVEDVRIQFAFILKKILEDEVDLGLVVDHREKLLSYARYAVEQNDYGIATLMYSTWVEHWLNDLIAAFLRRSQLDEDDVVRALRDIPIRSKIGWVLSFLKLPDLDHKVRNSIIQLIDNRNQFVHYKWKDQGRTVGREQERSFIDFVKSFEAIVDYLTEYEIQHLYGGSADPFEELFQQPPL